jgi:hypothetical protein
MDARDATRSMRCVRCAARATLWRWAMASTNDRVALIGNPCCNGSAFMLVQLAVDGRNLTYPASAFPVLHVHDLIRRPMEMKGDEGYLLVQRIEGVANYPPSAATSARNSCRHWGQTAEGEGSSNWFHSL